MIGVSVSLLSAVLISAGFFVFGYLIALKSPTVPLARSNDDDDKKKTTTSSGRFVSWAKAMVSSGAKDGVMVADSQRTKQKKPTLLEIETLADIFLDFKMVLVVRNDLKMGKGKIAAQCSHATLGLYKKFLQRAPKSLSRWEMCGQVKVVLKIDSEEDMLVLQERAKSLKLPSHITIDAGRTQIAPNSRTVMAILGPADVVDDVTGGLKLM